MECQRGRGLDEAEVMPGGEWHRGERGLQEGELVVGRRGESRRPGEAASTKGHRGLDADGCIQAVREEHREGVLEHTGRRPGVMLEVDAPSARTTDVMLL